MAPPDESTRWVAFSDDDDDVVAVEAASSDDIGVLVDAEVLDRLSPWREFSFSIPRWVGLLVLVIAFVAIGWGIAEASRRNYLTGVALASVAAAMLVSRRWHGPPVLLVTSLVALTGVVAPRALLEMSLPGGARPISGLSPGQVFSYPASDGGAFLYRAGAVTRLGPQGSVLFSLGGDYDDAVVGADDTLLRRGANQTLTFYDAEGRQRWTLQVRAGVLAIADGVVVLVDYDRDEVVALDADGTRVWTLPSTDFRAADAAERPSYVDDAFRAPELLWGWLPDGQVAVLATSGRRLSTTPDWQVVTWRDINVSSPSRNLLIGSRAGVELWRHELDPGIRGIYTEDRFLIATYDYTEPAHVLDLETGVEVKVPNDCVVDGVRCLRHDPAAITAYDLTTGAIAWTRPRGIDERSVVFGSGAVVIESPGPSRLPALAGLPIRNKVTVLDSHTGHVTAAFLANPSSSVGAGPGRAVLRLGETDVVVGPR